LPTSTLPGTLVRAFLISLALHVFLFWPSWPILREVPTGAVVTATLRSATSTPSNLPDPARGTPPGKAPQGPPSPPMPVAAAPAENADPISISTAAAPARSDPAAGADLDAEGLRGYRVALAREMRRHKRYPVRAIAAGWSGTAAFRVAVSENGAAQVDRLTRSSGHDVLDDAAAQMLQLAAPATPLPAALRGRAFAIDLPVVFELPE